MALAVIGGRAHPALTAAVADRLGIETGERRIETLPDGEIIVRVDERLQGDDVFLIQPTGPPADRHLLELLLLSDACRRAGAGRITAVIPYFGYARQDRRTADGGAIGARVVADVVGTRVDRIITLHLHNPAIEGFFTVPVEHLVPVAPITARLEALVPENAVVVAPDLGAVKLAQRCADDLECPVAYVHKERFGGDRVRVRRVVGDVSGRFPVLVDDMISTGGTMVSAFEAMLERGCRTPVTVAATHALPGGTAMDRLRDLPVGAIVVTNSLPQAEDRRPLLDVVDVAPLIAGAVERVHRSETT